MAVDELAEGDAHLLLDVAGLVDVPGDAEELGAGVVRLAEPREPGAAAAQDGRRDRDGLDVVDGRRAAVEAHIGGGRGGLGGGGPPFPPGLSPGRPPPPRLNAPPRGGGGGGQGGGGGG